jgi:hypothetical protein
VPRFLRPTAAFASVELDIVGIDPGERFGRIFFGKYPDPLGYGKTPSRFSDPRRRVARNRFGVLYLGRGLKVCFLEAVLRDQRNGAVGDLPMDEAELRARVYAEIAVSAPLNLVDLRDDGCIRMGIPTDVAHASDQRAGRAWSIALHDHPAQPDGLVYPSRLNEETNLAIFGRAAAKLKPVASQALIAAPGLAGVLDDLRVALI